MRVWFVLTDGCMWETEHVLWACLQVIQFMEQKKYCCVCGDKDVHVSRIGGEEYNTCVLLQFLGRRVNVRHTEKEIESGTPICYLFCVCNMTFSFLSCQYSNWIKLKIEIRNREWNRNSGRQGDREQEMKNTKITFPITVYVWCEWYRKKGGPSVLLLITLDFAHVSCGLKASVWTCVSTPPYHNGTNSRNPTVVMFGGAATTIGTVLIADQSWCAARRQ